MRRKSERNKVRSPEKKVERPSRRTRRRRGTPESEDEPQEEVEIPQTSKEDVKPNPEIIAKNPSTDSKESVSNSDEETKEQSVWQVKSETPSDTGEIQKLKICLQRPSSIERSPRKGHHGSSQESADSSEEVRKKRSKKHYHSNDVPSAETTIKQEIDLPDTVEEPETRQKIMLVSTEQNHDTECKIVKTETQRDEKHSDEKTTDVEPIVKNETISNNAENVNTDVTDVSEHSTENITVEVQKENVDDEKTVESTTKIETADNDLEKSGELVVKSDESDVKIEAQVQEKHETEVSTEKSEKPVEEVDSSKVEQLETTVGKAPEPVTEEPKMEVEVIDNSENKESEEKQERSHTPKRNSRFDVEVVVDKSENIENKKCEEKSPKSRPPRRNSRFDTRSPEKSIDKKSETDSTDKNGETDDKNGGILERTNSTEAEKVTRKRRWGSKRTTSTDKKPVVAISTDSLKNLISDVKPLPIGDVQLEVRNDKSRSDTNKNETISEVKDNADTDKLDQSEKDYEPHSDSSNDEFEKKRARSRKSESDRNENRSEHRSRRKVSVNENVPLKQSNQPKNKPSEVLYITNLVRPFTVLQLKGMLARTGKLVENGFWIDNIKSKCFVHFENEDQAVETRHALHGTRWPASNPKLLQVEFSTIEEMEKCVSSVPPPPPADTVRRTIDNDRVAMAWLTEQNFKDERFRDRDALRDKKQSVREWDMGKQDPSIENMEKFPRDVPVEYPREAISRERRGEDRYDGRDKRRSRSRSPVRRFNKRKEEEAPAKRLDDLFKKTKVTPCIYWLPLTPEQIAVKEEMRRQHMAEHERRKEEIRKQERERDRERQSFRERDKSNRRQRSSPGRNMSQNNRSGDRNNH